MDFHCHLDLYPDPFEVVATAKKKGTFILSVTTTPSAYEKTALLARDCSNIETGLGLHPELVHQRFNELPLLDKWIHSTDFVGEVGLDGSPRYKDSWKLQIKAFTHALKLADIHGGRILSIHSRQAATEVMDCLESFKHRNTFILHWFSGSVKELNRAIELGCWFSIGPLMLRGKKGKNLVSRIPQDRILLETDGPFASINKQSLYPWDANCMCVPQLSELWGIDPYKVSILLDYNKKVLLSKRTFLGTYSQFS